MDSKLATVFAEVIDEYIEAIQWCSGSADFGEGGQARDGWNKIMPPLLDTKVSIVLCPLSRDGEDFVNEIIVNAPPVSGTDIMPSSQRRTLPQPHRYY